MSAMLRIFYICGFTQLALKIRSDLNAHRLTDFANYPTFSSVFLFSYQEMCLYLHIASQYIYMKQGLNIQIGLSGRCFCRDVNLILLWGWLLFALSVMTACDDDSEKEKGGKIELSWDDVKPELPPDFVGAGDNDSAEVEIKEISVWLHPADGSPATEYTFSDRQDFSKQQFNFPVGEYRIFSTVNLLPPYIDEYNPTQNRAFTDGKEHFITLEKPNLSPEPAYCYEDRIVITENSVQTVKVKMKEVLAEVTVVINGIPRGSHFIGTVEKCHRRYHPEV